MKTSNKKRIIRLCESAVMLSAGVVLGFVKLFDLPYGGSVTLCSMLPIIIISYRYGTFWGLGCGFVFSIIQLLLGIKSLSFATSAGAVTAIIFLDYIVAFSVLGLGGIYKKIIKNQILSLSLGTFTVGILRLFCHIISGCTVWAGLSIPSKDAFVYSVIYNAGYMLPEMAVTLIAAILISASVELGGEKLKLKNAKNKLKKSKTSK